MPATESEFKGKPVLELRDKPDDKYGLTFGAVKARLILANLDAIRAFVAKHEANEAAVRG